MSFSREHLNDAMLRLADGDRSAFDVVFAGVVPVVRRVAASMLRATPADVDDAVQLAVTKLFAQASKFQRDGDVVRWAVALVGWECRTLRQRRRREVLNAERPGQLIGQLMPTPEELAITDELIGHVHELLGDLSEADRALLTRTVSGEPAAERKRRQRATDRLKALWRKYHGTV